MRNPLSSSLTPLTVLTVASERQQLPGHVPHASVVVVVVVVSPVVVRALLPEVLSVRGVGDGGGKRAGALQAVAAQVEAQVVAGQVRRHRRQGVRAEVTGDMSNTLYY